MRTIIKKLCAGAAYFVAANLILAQAVFALPEGGVVQSGDAGFVKPDISTLNINQSTDKAIIDWSSFSIANSETVSFNQPGSDSIALNRVTGGSISEIFGALNANGKVWLLNPNGMVFGPGSKINAAGFLASTLNISNEDFLNKVYTFSKSPGSNGYIVNKGEIVVKEGGYVMLLGDSVHNEGIIEAKLGKVILASGEKMTLELDSGGVMSVVIDEAVSEAVKDEQGNDVKDAVLNTGTIIADGGKVILTASVLESIFENAVNNEGIIRAASLVKEKGEVYLLAEGEDAKAVNKGRIDVSAKDEGADGGFVEVSGDRVDIDKGSIDVTSKSGKAGHFLLDPVGDFWIVDGAAGDNNTGTTVGEAWLEAFDGSLTLQVDNDVYFLIDDNNLDLQKFNAGETFRIEAGKDINMNDDSITTQGGSVELVADGFGAASGDGIGDVNLGIGDGISTNGGNVLLSGVNLRVTAPVMTNRGNVDFTAANDVFHGPRGDVLTSGGYFNGIAGHDYILMNDAEVDTAGGTKNIVCGGPPYAIYLGSDNPQTESRWSWEYVDGDRWYLFKEFGYYYYDTTGAIVYVPLV
ncbi:MAG: filamentous hemagglutinin N-terminal domain-containing protein, partial [Candidatus Omnitrophota bacterium]